MPTPRGLQAQRGKNLRTKTPAVTITMAHLLRGKEMRWLERISWSAIGVAVGVVIALGITTATDVGRANRIKELQTELATRDATIAENEQDESALRRTVLELGAAHARQWEDQRKQIEKLSSQLTAATAAKNSPAAVAPSQKTTVIGNASETEGRSFGVSRAAILAAISEDFNFDARADEEEFYGLGLNDLSIWCQILGPADAPVCVEVNAIADKKTASILAPFYSLIASVLEPNTMGFDDWFAREIPRCKTGETYSATHGGIKFTVRRDGAAYAADFVRAD